MRCLRQLRQLRQLRRIRVTLAAFLALIAGAGPTRVARAETAETRQVHVEAAVHRGEVVGSSIAWRSRLLLDVGAAAPGESWGVRLAVPLPRGETLTGPEGVSAIVEDGRIIGFRADPSAVSGRALTLGLTQPLDVPRSHLHLGAPLAAGDGVQIVDIDGDGGARFEPDAALGLDRHVGYFAPRALGEPARRECERQLDYRPHPGDNAPLYVRAEGAITLRGGLDGALSTRAERSRGGIIGAGVAFAAIVAILIGARSRLSRVVHEEEADALLTAEFERLEKRAPREPAASDRRSGADGSSVGKIQDRV